jgi:hypothetical protein
LEWVFVAPRADLFGADFTVVGNHFGGPTWASNDSSAVVGQLVASVAAPASKKEHCLVPAERPVYPGRRRV